MDIQSRGIILDLYFSFYTEIQNRLKNLMLRFEALIVLMKILPNTRLQMAFENDSNVSDNRKIRQMRYWVKKLMYNKIIIKINVKKTIYRIEVKYFLAVH